MLLTGLVAFNQVRVWVPTIFLSASMVPFATASFVVGAASWIVPRRLSDFLDDCLYASYLRLTLFVFENSASVRIHLYGDIEDLKRRPENAVTISNHQSNVDWAIITLLAARQNNEAGLRFIVKSVIHFVPLFGWYVFQHGYVYVRRFGSFVPDPLLRQFDFLRSLSSPFWLHVFPEGTRFDRRKTKVIADSQAFAATAGLGPARYTLIPRTGAFSLAVKELRPVLNAVYDVTIAYGQTLIPNRVGDAPGMLEYVDGPASPHKHVHVHVKRIPVEELPPNDDQALKKWLYERFRIKDELMTNFFLNKTFPDLVDDNALKISFSRTALPFFVFSAALVAPFFYRNVRIAYLATIAFSPCLLAWLHVRQNV